MQLSEEQIAINRLVCGNTAHSCKAGYIKLAIKALEKQVEKKPIENEIYGVSTSIFCPNCESELYAGQTYCDKCGQKILWKKREV